MPVLREYKKKENAIYRRFSARLGRAAHRTGRGLARLFSGGRQKLTIMVIPHDERKIRDVQLSFFGVAGIALASVALIVAFGLSLAHISGSRRQLDQDSQDLAAARANLDSLREQTGRLATAAKQFETALSNSLASVGVAVPASESPGPGGSLSSFLGIDSSGGRDADELSKLDRLLEQSSAPIEQIGYLLRNQNAVMSDIPNIWPIKGGIGHISMYFGQNTNPFTGQWYTHTGLDISTFGQGDPIVATADGTVVSLSYESGGYGNNIILRHKHGFYTRYAHLQAFRVRRGQEVKQGQVIGILGNTGLTTGPHVHYEVRLGRDLIDPTKFLNVGASAIVLSDKPAD
ncbi:MAG TPA: M23 family metallopeptidase [Rectinemataceae bacterium]|nr:M23 family metallopeptidase [Rectinemataceae bacterium]